MILAASVPEFVVTLWGVDRLRQSWRLQRHRRSRNSAADAEEKRCGADFMEMMRGGKRWPHGGADPCRQTAGCVTAVLLAKQGGGDGGGGC